MAFPGYCEETVTTIIEKNRKIITSGNSSVSQINTQIVEIDEQIETIANCINPKIAEALESYLMAIYEDESPLFAMGEFFNLSESANGNLTDWNVLTLEFDNNDPAYDSFVRLNNLSLCCDGDQTDVFEIATNQAPDIAFAKNGSEQKDEIAANLESYLLSIYGSSDHILAKGDLFNGRDTSGNLVDWNVLKISFSSGIAPYPEFIRDTSTMFLCPGNQTTIFNHDSALATPNIAFARQGSVDEPKFTRISSVTYNSGADYTTVVINDPILSSTHNLCYTCEAFYDNPPDEQVENFVTAWNDSTDSTSIVDIEFANIQTVTYDGMTDKTTVTLVQPMLDEGQTMCFTIKAYYDNPPDDTVTAYVNDWNVGHDYIVKDTVGTDGSYGLQNKKSGLETAKETITSNINKATSAISSWTKYLTGGFPST